MVNYKKFFLISLAISLISAVALIFFTTDADTIEALAQIRPVYILAALALQILTYLLTARKTKFLARSLGYDVHTRHMLENVLAGILLASVTPSSVGGEPIRILLLNKNSGVPVGKSTAIIFMERLLDVFFIFVCLIPSIFILHTALVSENDGALNLGTLLLIALVILCLVVAVLLYGVFRPESAKRGIRYFLVQLSKIAPAKYHSKIDRWIITSGNEMDLFHSSFKRFVSAGKVSLLISLFYTFVYWMTHFTILLFILMGLNVRLDLAGFLLLYATQVVLAIIMVIPATPGASGIAEISAYSLFSLFVPAPLVGVVVIAWRAITYYVNIIAGTLAGLRVIRRYGINAFADTGAEPANSKAPPQS
ncbi:flippase-like domain-containing protein [Methanolapillus millepedarum]|uniref:Flippase-like domain-containing protein n=1 Tax=Methanolapillus millepedarum TaxID=3028296 RepID=A0AA96V3A2_9EURY|nr:hypothetical protein MsAc7_05690 [Methanosarcinaceae archaeon Ac7]